ncbi:hypothetical protein GEV37_08995 [Halomonas malpeensis]|uniref:HTH araC/xylS-type domain-containing protein n=1 Tax=Vreelandella malpeensis TaxID=1172368 RepID=A0ABS8DT75_9GAMM|nr:hypothetical protein [Halomonas malpeensis]
MSHFRSCFHQLFDITPRQFRKAYQQEGHAD